MSVRAKAQQLGVQFFHSSIDIYQYAYRERCESVGFVMGHFRTCTEDVRSAMQNALQNYIWPSRTNIIFSGFRII